ncbi:unnamed protein product [Rhizoctonia solani]|uniref:Uncharacterized protein n=1 Tax=Rhizoctonia solani TaxID=456999 RepID=A0A8H3B5Q2_9AGAM|nr:unnamed protein product [Rhizoctonia solani]
MDGELYPPQPNVEVCTNTLCSLLLRAIRKTNNIVPPEVSRSLALTLRHGDSLRDDAEGPITAKRRALVVVVRYSTDKRGLSGLGLTLEGTPDDPWGIYNMLVYEKKIIFILYEDITHADHHKPTRANIIDGWFPIPNPVGWATIPFGVNTTFYPTPSHLAPYAQVGDRTGISIFAWSRY